MVVPQTRQFDYSKKQAYLWDVDDPTGQSQEEYHDKMWEERQAARAHPLSTETVFRCALQCATELPSGTETRRAIHLTPDFKSCRLIQPLKTGENTLSQVWVAQVFPPSCEVLVTDEILVVFKILQPSLMIIPPGDYDRGDIEYDGEYVNPLSVAQKEQQTYMKLRDLQGSLIPYFFGLHEFIDQITTPSGEQCTAVVMEYIDGPTVFQLSDYADNPSDTDPGHAIRRDYTKWQNLARAAIDGLYKIHTRGMIQGDVRQVNLVYDSFTDQCVFIDFGQSALEDSDDPWDQWVDHGMDWEKLTLAFGRVTLHMERIMRWLKSVVPEDLALFESYN